MVLEEFYLALTASHRLSPLPGRIPDWSADSRVRAFLASDQVRADKAVRAPVSTLLSGRLLKSALPGPGNSPVQHSARSQDLLPEHTRRHKSSTRLVRVPGPQRC